MTVVPNGVLYYAPITLKYYYKLIEPHVEIESMQNISTTYSTTNQTQLGTTYQQQIFIPLKWAGSTTSNSVYSNVVFFDASGKYLNSWLENIGGIATAGTTAMFWVKNAGFQTNPTTQQMTFASTSQLYSNILTVWTTTYSTTTVTVYSSTIYMGFTNKLNYLFNSSGTTGCNYLLQLGKGGVDNGANIFDYYAGFEVPEVPLDWMMMFIWKPDFPPTGGIVISSLGGWQGYITSYVTKSPQILEAFFNSGLNATACVGTVGARFFGTGSTPVDLASNAFNKPVGNMASNGSSTNDGAFMQLEFRTPTVVGGGYFGEWCIQTSQMDAPICAGYAFDNTPYVMSIFAQSSSIQAQVNYGNTSMTSQSSRQTPGVPFFKVNVPGLTGFFDFGDFSGGNTTFYWVRTREFVQQQPTAIVGALQKNATNETVTISLGDNLGVS